PAASSAGLIFAWHDWHDLNRFQGADGQSHQAAWSVQGAARRGRFGEMTLQGGSIRPSDDAAGFALAELKKASARGFEALLIPPNPMPPIKKIETLVSIPGLSLTLIGGNLSFLTAEGSWQITSPFPDQPFHLAINHSGKDLGVWINGNPIS